MVCAGQMMVVSLHNKMYSHSALAFALKMEQTAVL
jgi:hypothetical protein